jgi:hypothetical protein
MREIMVKIELDSDFDKFYLKIIGAFFKNSRTYSYKEVARIIKVRFGISFKELLIMKPAELEKIAKVIKNNPLNFPYSEEKKFVDMYGKYRSNQLSKIVINKIGLKACPYCNRNYIYNFKRSNSLEATAQLDHFYDKAKYSYLALSLYNLIPSCSTCNLRKSANDVVTNPIFNPYFENLDNHANFTSLGIISVDKLKDQELSFFAEERISLELKRTTSDTRTDKHIEVFNIEAVYEHHKDIIAELYQKRVIYSDDYIDELIASFKGEVFSDRDELLKLITCSSIKKDEIHKRPLSKLTRDIAKELKFIEVTRI